MMNSIYDSSQRWTFFFIFIAILIVISSGLISDLLIKDLAREERQKMEVWSEATRMMTSEESSSQMGLILKIIEGNTSIPIILCSEHDSVIYHNNLDLPETNVTQYLKRKIQAFKAHKDPILIDMGEGVCQYLYFDDSTHLKWLLIYPYAQLFVVFIFIFIAFLALVSIKRAEQNKVWVGLSKETAHQLGTPISSLIAWIEFLRLKQIDPLLIDEMEKDIQRLSTISERFSKIGSHLDSTPINLIDAIQKALAYMETRISSKVQICALLPNKPVFVCINDSLFSWVVENIVKNAIDAMEGHGKLLFRVEEHPKEVFIDIQDTGKGLAKIKFRTIFHPGYTTKKRGWGLGLSLAKRIIESFPGGKIFVKSSELGKGTTFRIKLKKYEK